MYLSHTPDPSLLTEEEIHNVKARYAASVTFTDRCVGMVLDAVDRLGLRDDTCIVWMSDHGTHLNEHGSLLSKRCMYTEVAHTVHMVRTPDGSGAGQRFSDLIQLPDLAPTVLDLAGVEVPERMQGKSYAPLLKGGECQIRDVAISATAPNANQPSAVITARDQRWQLIDQPDPSQRTLHDLENDPEQLVNVAEDYPDEVARLHEAVIEFLKSHEAQSQVVRWFEEGDPGDMTGYVDRRLGYERFHVYWQHILDSEVIG